MKTSSLTPTRLAFAIVAAGAVGAAGTSFVFGSHAHAAVPGVAVPATAVAVTGAIGAPDFSEIAQRYGAAVVNITVSGTKHVVNDSGEGPTFHRHDIPQPDPSDPFFEFFKRFQLPNGGFPGPGGPPVHGQGSGFIVGTDGMILTNAHVVDGARDVTVRLTDHREFEAKVLGSDPKTDVAVLKIDARNLPTAPLGSARDLKVGEWVLAIGSPFGFDNSVSAGVVSAKGRSLPGDGYVPFIQTDAAVNPGNSGGPLFNARGEVVGITSQIFSRTGGYQGLSFAIPIDLATKVKDQIVATGKASHARLGVMVQEVNQTLADSFKLDRPRGALISDVDKGGPADKAGLKTGDVILGVNGQAIETSGDLPAVIGQASPGDKMKLDIWRQGNHEELTAMLGDASERGVSRAKAEPRVGEGKLGLELRPLQPQEKREAGVNNGLLVEDASGPAARAGIQAGDVLVAVNGTAVTGIDQVREIVAKSAKSVALLIERDGSKIFVPVRLG